MLFQRFIVFLLLMAVLSTAGGARPRASSALQQAVMAKFPARLETLAGVEFASYLANKASQGVLAESVRKVFRSKSAAAAKALHYEQGLKGLESFYRSTGKDAPIARAYQQLAASEQEMLGEEAIKDRLIDDEKIGEFYQSLVKVLQEYGYDTPQQSYQEMIGKITGQ